MSKTALIYDCEIVKAIPPPALHERDPTIEYCEGWDDHGNMGISVITAIEMNMETFAYTPRVFLADNFDQFALAVDLATTVVGFNNIQFDDKLVDMSGVCVIPPEKSWDLLVSVWRAHGLPDTYQGDEQKGYGLDVLAKANGLPGKTGNGALAPVLWQKGEYGEVIDYCMHDTWLTAMLVEKLIKYGLTSPIEGLGTMLIAVSDLEKLRP